MIFLLILNLKSQTINNHQQKSWIEPKLLKNMAGTQYINIIYINYLSLILIAHSTMGNLQEICCTSMDK